MLEAVDLNWFWQFICFSLAAVFGLLYLVRKSASRFFLLDSNFDSDPIPTPTNMWAPDFLGSCLVCGLKTKNQCAACKVAKYCSGACQKSHWSEHKKQCKDLASSYKANRANSTSLSSGRRAFPVHQGRSSKILTHSNQILFPYEDFVKLFNWEKSGYPPCGLTNCGNSCFANVVLQCLAYTRPLVAYLLEKGHRIECHSEDWCFFCEFQTHIERTSQSARPFSPINILSRLPNIGGNLGYGKQEDAHEFMRFAIDNMQSVCLDKFGGEKAVHPSCQETTLIQHIFGGRLQSQVICTECNNVSNQFENMMDLTVEIHGDAESLEQCLDQFTAKEQLHGDNMYKCDGCNAYVMAWKRLLIQRAPNILTIALKRFQSGRFGKLNKKVSFPETLDLNAYMSDSGDGNDVYKLYAVIVHVDMLNASYFGHYICFVKDLRGSWYRIDDCKVESVELDEVLSQGAYMLMYTRVSVRPSCLLPDESLRKDDSEKLRIEEINSSRNHPAECSSASGHLESSVDFEQPSSASELRINSEEELSSILDAQDEKCSTSESNPVVKEVEIHGSAELSTAPKIVSPVNTYLIGESTEQKDIKDIELSLFAAVEDVNRSSERSTSGGLYTKLDEESRATNNETFEKVIGTCDGLSSVITDSTKSKIRNRSQSSVDIQDTVDKSDPGSAANVAPADFTEMAQNSNLKDQMNGIERAVFADIELQEGEELSTAPEEISESYANRPVHTKTSLIGKTAMQPIFENIGNHSLSASKVASQGNESDPDEPPGRICEESHADENCTIEEDGRVCNNVSSSVIADVHIGDEMNTVNSSCGTEDSKPTAKRPDPESSAAKLKPIFSRGFLVKKRHADGNRTIKEDENMCNNVSSPVITAGQIRDEANTLNSSYVSRSMKSTAKRLDLESSAVKLKPIFSPSLHVKNQRKKFFESRDEVPDFRDLAPDCHLNNKIDEVETPCLLGENGGSLKDAEKPCLMHANGKALVDSYICPSVENGDSCVHNLDIRDNGQTQSLITNVISNCSLEL